MGVVEIAALQWFRVACPGALQRLGRHNWEIRVRISTRTRSKGSPKMATCVFRPRRSAHGRLAPYEALSGPRPTPVVR